MSRVRNLPLPHEGIDATRIVLVSSDLQRISSYCTFLETEGFEVLVAFDLHSALEICRRSVRPVRAAVILTETGETALNRDGGLVRGLSGAAPTIPCILLPQGSTAPECAVLIRTAMRCTAAAYMGSS